MDATKTITIRSCNFNKIHVSQLDYFYLANKLSKKELNSQPNITITTKTGLIMKCQFQQDVLVFELCHLAATTDALYYSSERWLAVQFINTIADPWRYLEMKMVILAELTNGSLISVSSLSHLTEFAALVKA